jgi:hypothetical protein
MAADGPAGAPHGQTSYEDFSVGHRLQTRERTVSREESEHSGAELAFSLLEEFDVAGTVRELQWSFLAPVAEHDAVRAEVLVTRCRRERAGEQGLVHRHVRVLRGDGQLLQEGTYSLLLSTRAAAHAPDPQLASDFCSPEWGELLASALAENDAFIEATRLFDGTIGLRAGEAEIQLRVFRARVLESGRSTPLGPTFTLAGSERAWTELAFAERNDFIARATRGEFFVRGNSYEYLRLTKALVAIFDEVRSLVPPR